MKNNKNRAGALQSNASICLHSSASMSLWFGSKGKAAGVVHFFSKTAVLEVAASKDDPYADHALLNIENAINQAFSKLGTLDEQLKASAGTLGRGRVQAGDCLSSKPVVFPLNIRNRFSWRMVALVELFDLFIVDVLDASFKARLTRTQSESFQEQARHCLRQVIELAMTHEHSGITRNDLAAKNAKANAAEKKFGLLPLEVAEGLIRAEFAPAIMH